MGFDFEKLKETVSELAQSGVAKAKELTDVALDKGKELGELGKLKLSNTTEKENIKKAYLELGRLYFAEKGHAPEAAYADLCQRVQAAQDKIAYNNQRMADIRAAGRGVEEDDDLLLDCDFSYVDEAEESDPAAPESVPVSEAPVVEEAPVVVEAPAEVEIKLTIDPSAEEGPTL